MDYHNLDQFQKEILLVESFFTELAAREDEVLTFGIRRAIQWESFENIQEILPIFESRILEFLVFARPIDKKIHDGAQELVNSSKLAESIASIQVSLKIASERRSIGVKGELFNSLIFHLPYFSNLIRRRRLFAEEVVSIQKILVALGRLRNYVKMLGDIYIRRWMDDSEIFRPSNLDEEKIIEHIEAAIQDIEKNSALPRDEREQLIEYLYKAKCEISEKRPSWNKIVGALVIVATLTGGIATAPQAYKNIDEAIQYILGTSVKRNLPESFHNMIEKPKKRRDDDDSDEDWGAGVCQRRCRA